MTTFSRFWQSWVNRRDVGLSRPAKKFKVQRVKKRHLKATRKQFNGQISLLSGGPGAHSEETDLKNENKFRKSDRTTVAKELKKSKDGL